MATVPFVLTLLGENLGPQAPPGSLPQLLLDQWNAAWSAECCNERGAGNSYVAGLGNYIFCDSEGDKSGGFSAESSYAVTSNLWDGPREGWGDGDGGEDAGGGTGGRRLGVGDDRFSRGGDPPGALELETVRAWLRHPTAACEGLVWAVSLFPMHLHTSPLSPCNFNPSLNPFQPRPTAQSIAQAHSCELYFCTVTIKS